jgi:hypothetical protein
MQHQHAKLDVTFSEPPQQGSSGDPVMVARVGKSLLALLN